MIEERVTDVSFDFVMRMTILNVVMIGVVQMMKILVQAQIDMHFINDIKFFGITPIDLLTVIQALAMLFLIFNWIRYIAARKSSNITRYRF